METCTTKHVNTAWGCDVLDDLAETVLEKQDAVWVIPRDRTPYNTGAASINRF